MASSSWFLYSLGAALSFSGLALSFKWLGGVLPAHVSLTYIAGLSTVCYFVHSLHSGVEFSVTREQLFVILLATVFAYFGNLFDLEGLRLAPNAGYASAIKGCQVLLITVLSYLLFAGQQITLMGVLGVCLVFAGGVLLALQRAG